MLKKLSENIIIQIWLAPILTTIIATVLLNVINIIQGNINFIYTNVFDFLAILSSFLCFSLYVNRKRTKIEYKYELIQYLFHNSWNQYTTIPKLILLHNMMMQNEVEIDNVILRCELFLTGEEIDSKFTWNIKEIKNIGHVNLTEYSLCSTCDIGIVNNISLDITYDEQQLKKELQFYESNEIKRTTVAFPKILKPGMTYPELKLLATSKNSMNINRNDALFIYPANYGKKIKKITFHIISNFEEEYYNIELYEIGKVLKNKKVDKRLIKQVNNCLHKKDGTIQREYYVSLSIKEGLKQENVYVLFLFARKNHRAFHGTEPERD